MGSSTVLAAQVHDSVDATLVIKPNNLQGWAFYNDGGAGGTNSFMTGPGTPPLGTGSVRLQITGDTDGYILYKSAWGGTLLSNFTSLSYSTYHDPSSLGSATHLPALVINVDYNLSDTDTPWQGRLIYDPYLTPGNIPVKGTWQTWNALIGLWWATDAPGNAICPQSAPCTLSTIIAAYPNIGVLVPTAGIGFKVGSGWENGFIGNVDKFVIGTSVTTDTYDFEPNTHPVANNQSVTTAEDTAKAITLTASDAEGDPLTWTVVTPPAHGSLTGTAPALTYTPALNYNGADSFTFKVNDGTDDSNTATVSITVTPVNDAPVCSPVTLTTAEDTPGQTNPSCTDVEGNTLTYSIVAQPTHGSASVAAGKLVYTPAANYNGVDSFTYKANDGMVDSNTATVSVTVTAVNDAPVANSQSVTTAEDTAKAITLTATDVEGSPLTWTVVTPPAHGTLTGTAPALTYTPALNYNGADSFTFKVNDGTVDSNVATVTITVTAVNDAPVANSQSVTTAEDTAKAITLTATDVEGNPLTWTVVTPPAHGTLTGTAPALTYTPALNYNGADSFTFKVNDGTVDSNVATVTITVTAVNDAPVANSQSVTTAEDTAKAITLTATDVEGSPLTWTVVTPPAHGTLTGTAPALTYTPALNYNGADSFTFKVNDGTVDSNVATVTITVTAVNYAPVANSQSITTAEDTAKAITLTATDVDGDPLTWTVVTPPAHGTLTGTAPALTYTPALNYNGADSFTFKVNDGTVDSNVATVTITVTPVNDAPIAVDDSYSTGEDTVLNVAAPGILANDTDPENAPLIPYLDSGPTHGTLSLLANGSIVYTPNPNYFGTDSFTYYVKDDLGLKSNNATVTITINMVRFTIFIPLVNR
jgi:VCBS repeat-containing protein